jgi:hypothetical protein
MINSLALFELPLLDRRFTWSNSQDTPVLARLDRAFFNQDWNLAFPNSSLVSHHRPTSDHFPIVVTAATSIPSPVVFRFENSWLLDAAFLPTTIPAWSRPVPDRNATAVVAAKVKRFRFSAKVWKWSHCYISLRENNCKFLLTLLDFFEESRPL